MAFGERSPEQRARWLLSTLLEEAMKFALLDTVVLNRDLPQHGLRAGDLGAVVELYANEGVEVEFVRPSGATKALVTLKTSDLRSVSEGDILAVRQA